VKQNAVGRGNASKEQVALMMRAQFRLQETPAYDAADAMAVGLAHIQARAMHPGLLPDVRQL
jgi:crossover junction endodeoxyribonuclease RuvC